nr:putative integron gene cassette protein [uncultured bacterium]
MTTEQRKLIHYWIFLGIVLTIGTLISLSDIENKQLAILLLTIPVVIVSIFQDFTYYKGYGANAERIGEFVEKHPLVKYWLVFFCLLILPFMVYAMATTDDDFLQGYLYFLSFILLIGPVAVVSELERFRSMGNNV